MVSYVIGIDIQASDNATSQINKAETSLLELDRAQDGVATGANAATDAVNKQKSAFGELGGQIQGMIVAYAGLKGVQLIGEMIEQGQAVNTATLTFQNLSGSVSSADANLRMMRESTGGVVSDFTLMSGANRLLLMNLAETGDEAAKLTQIAVTLGRAMGHDAGESVEAFAALLANQSIPRLDNFGISSDRVRQRLEELKEAGMGAQAAFSQAVMEQGALALDRLGSATTAAITPVEQLKTTWTNFWDTFDSRVAQGVNGLIGIAQYATGTLPQQAQEAEAQAAGQDFVSAYYDMIAYAMSSDTGQDWQGLAGKDRDKFAAAINTAFQGLSGLDNMADRTSWGDVLSSLTEIPDSVKYGLVEFVEGAMEDAQVRGARAAQSVGETLGSSMVEGLSHTMRGSGKQDTSDQITLEGHDDARNYWYAYMDESQIQQDALNEQRRQQSVEGMSGQAQAISDAQAAMGGFMGAGAGIGDYAFQEQADAMAAKFEEIKALGEQGLISQADVEKASALNDQVQDAAEAMKNLKLPDVFGQGTGGIQGQITDDLIAQMQASGNLKPEEIEALKQQLDLQSGRETSASVAYQEDILPIINDLATMDPAAAAEAVKNYAAFLELAAQKKLTPEEIAAFGATPTGYGYTGMGASPFTVAPGQTPGEIAAMLGVPVEQVLGMTGAANAGAMMPGQYMGGAAVQALPGFSMEGLFGGKAGTGGMEETAGQWSILQTSLQDMVPDAQNISDSFGTLKTNTNSISNTIAQMNTDLETLGKGTHKIDVALNITNLDFINSLIAGQHGGAQGASGTTKVRDNGGQVAGTDNRTGPS